jgi:hypothetical protein
MGKRPSWAPLVTLLQLGQMAAGVFVCVSLWFYRADSEHCHVSEALSLSPHAFPSLCCCLRFALLLYPCGVFLTGFSPKLPRWHPHVLFVFCAFRGVCPEAVLRTGRETSCPRVCSCPPCCSLDSTCVLDCRFYKCRNQASTPSSDSERESWERESCCTSPIISHSSSTSEGRVSGAFGRIPLFLQL